MELCTAPPISNLPHRRLLASNYTHLQWKASLPLKQPSFPRTQPGLRYYTNSSLRSTTSEETSSGPTQYVGEEPGRSTTSEETSSGPTQYVGEEPGVVTVEDVQPVEKNSFAEIEQKEVPKEDSAMDGQFLAFEFLDKLDIKLDSEDTYSVLLFGSGALVALWIGTAIVTAIDSIPLFPKLLEVVGLAYTLWFSTRYLIFKKNREELVAKIEEIKQQVLGSNSD